MQQQKKTVRKKTKPIMSNKSRLHERKKCEIQQNMNLCVDTNFTIQYTQFNDNIFLSLSYSLPYYLGMYYIQGCIYGCRDCNQAKANQNHSGSEILNFCVQKRFFIIAFIINFSLSLFGAVKTKRGWETRFGFIFLTPQPKSC